MKNSSVKFYVHTAFSCRLPELPYHQGNPLLFRNGIIKIACTKVSAGVSTGIGDHEAKYEGSEEKDCGDEQFEIADTRSLKQMYDDIKQQGLWPVLNDYLYV